MDQLHSMIFLLKTFDECKLGITCWSSLPSSIIGHAKLIKMSVLPRFSISVPTHSNFYETAFFCFSLL